MNRDSSKSDYKPFQSPYPDPPDLRCSEAELSEGATQPPTDRPPPADPPPDLINETNVFASADPLRKSDNEEEDDDADPLASFFANDLDFYQYESPGKVANHEYESVWKTVTHQASSSCPFTIGIEEFLHQKLVLYGLTFNKRGISIKADLNDGHPISKCVLVAHAEIYVESRDKEKVIGTYYRGDFIISRRECNSSGQPRPVEAVKNTTPFKRLFPSHVDEAISDMESAWKLYFGKSRNIIWHRRHKESSVVSEVNVTAPVLLAILHRSCFISIRYNHYATLNNLVDHTIPCCECAPYNKYVLRTMACLTQIHQNICDTLERVKKKSHNVFEWSMNEMYTDTSKYLVYYYDEKNEFRYKYIELPHFVIIKLHRGDRTIPLAMFYQQVPPYYFGIPVSLQNQKVTTPVAYSELISSSGEYSDISRYFPVIIEKVNEKLAKERDIFFTYRSDLRGNDQLLQIYPYRFNQNKMPDCSCRYIEITIHEKVATGGCIGL